MVSRSACVALFTVAGGLAAAAPASASRYLYLEQYDFNGKAGDVAFISDSPLGGVAQPTDVPTLVCYAGGAACDEAQVQSPQADLFQVALGDTLTWGYSPANRTAPGNGANPGNEPGVYVRGFVAELTVISLLPTDVVYAFQYDFKGQSSGFVVINDGYLPTTTRWTETKTKLCFIGATSCGVANYITPSAGLVQLKAGNPNSTDEIWGFNAPSGQGNPIDTPGLYTRNGLASLDVIGPVSSAPEPATWMTLVLGFGLAGGAVRSRSAQMRRARI